MKYLYVAPRYHTNYIPRINELIKLGHEVRFLVQFKGFTEDYSSITPEVMKQTGLSKAICRLIAKKNPQGASAMNKAFIPAILPLAKAISQYRPDVVIVRDRIWTSFITYWICRLLGNKRVILYDHSPLYVKRIRQKSLKSWIKKGLQKHLFPGIRMTVVEYSEYPKEDEKSLYDKVPYSYFVPFACKSSTECNEHSYCRDGCVRILDVGKYRDYKNHFVLVDAISLLEEANFKVTIIGQCSTGEEQAYYDTLSGYIYDRHLEDKFELLTNIKHRDMEKYYMEHDIFVLTSIKEQASVAVLEAMSCGMAVISSSANGSATYIDKGYSGEIFMTQDAGDLAGILRRLIFHPDYIKRLGANAAAAVRDIYAPKNYAAALEDIITKNF
jgi:glycosyltransferase involved in cell wall biosynthesis